MVSPEGGLMEGGTLPGKQGLGFRPNGLWFRPSGLGRIAVDPCLHNFGSRHEQGIICNRHVEAAGHPLGDRQGCFLTT